MNDTLTEAPRRGNSHLFDRIEIVEGDICGQAVDAVISTITKKLDYRGGLSQAVLNAAGNELDEWILDNIHEPRSGNLFVAPPFKLVASNILFVVTPSWRDSFEREDRDLIHCYRSALQVAREHGFKTLAFPVIGAGKSGFPPQRAARIAVQTLRDHIHEDFQSIKLVCHSAEICTTLRQVH